jgi:hypothetical protein
VIGTKIRVFQQYRGIGDIREGGINVYRTRDLATLAHRTGRPCLFLASQVRVADHADGKDRGMTAVIPQACRPRRRAQKMNAKDAGQ